MVSAALSSSASAETKSDAPWISLEENTITESLAILAEVEGVTIEVEGSDPDHKLNRSFPHFGLESSLHEILQPLDYVVIWGSDGVISVMVGMSLPPPEQDENSVETLGDLVPLEDSYIPSLSESELVPPQLDGAVIPVIDDSGSEKESERLYAEDIALVPPDDLFNAEEDGIDRSYLPASPVTAPLPDKGDTPSGYLEDVPPDDDTHVPAPTAANLAEPGEDLSIPSFDDQELVPFTQGSAH